MKYNCWRETKVFCYLISKWWCVYVTHSALIAWRHRFNNLCTNSSFQHFYSVQVHSKKWLNLTVGIIAENRVLMDGQWNWNISRTTTIYQLLTTIILPNNKLVLFRWRIGIIQQWTIYAGDKHFNFQSEVLCRQANGKPGSVRDINCRLCLSAGGKTNEITFYSTAMKSSTTCFDELHRWPSIIGQQATANMELKR